MRWVAVVVLFVCGCGDCDAGADPPTEDETRRVEADLESEPPAEPTADLFDGPPTPTTLRVVSEAAVRRLDLSFGPAAPFGLGVVGESVAALALDQADSPRWPRGCDCPCDIEGGCPECEPPEPFFVTIGPDATHELEWNGLLRRFRFREGQGLCFETLPAAPGRYVLSVCAADDGPCTTTEAELPAADGITLDLDDPTPPPRCPLDADVLSRAAATALDHLERARVPAAIRSDCPRVAACVPADEVDSRIDPDEPSCLLYATPLGDTLDVVVQTARTRYVHHLAARATRTIGLSYPPR